MKREIDQYANVLRLSGGGVTLSGGEPLVQSEFASAVFRYCKALGVHTALDTSGRLGERLNDEELRDVDLTLLDIKSGDPATYVALTGQPLEPTLAFARRLSALGRRMWIRFVLVPGLTDAPDNVEAVAAFAASLDGVERVEILRFHQLGRQKWHDLNLAYTLEDTEPPGDALVARVKAQFRRHGLAVY
jgi:pyruvate formate lyase activating enzyme